MRRLLRRFRHPILLLAGVALLAVGVPAGWAVLDPAGATNFAARFFTSGFEVRVGSARWTSIHSIAFADVTVGGFLKVPKAELAWSWRRLARRHLAELRLQGAQVSVSLADFAGRGPATAKPSASPGGRAWILERLRLERGGLVLVGVAPSLPPLSLEVDGEFRGVPLGLNASPEQRRRVRAIELRSLKVQSPVDCANTLLYVEKLLVEFSLDGLERRELERLRIDRPRIDVDRGLFWFVDELRKATASAPARPPAAGEPRWRARKLEIAEGRLDITRLREIALKYPLEFQLSQEDVQLEDLSLASFRLELVIPEQDISWPARQLEFRHLGGKIAFNLGKGGDGAANDLVNTLHVEQVRWKDLPLDQAWVSFTFAPATITGNFGGRLAKGYLNGGLSCGWSGDEPWAFWGAAADVDAGEFCAALASKHFAMDGRAELKFALKGERRGLDGSLALRSLTKGTMNIEAIDSALDKVEKNTEGVKREALRALLGTLRDYPYDGYSLDVAYHKPDATLALRAEGPLGKRALDLRWHGLPLGQEAGSAKPEVGVEK